MSFWRTLFGRSSASAPVTDSRFAEVARLYNPDNVRQLIAILETIYESIYAVQNDPEVVAFYASFACEVAVFVREQSDVDICTLTFPMEAPPLAPSHPLMKALPLLEIWIEDYFKGLREVVWVNFGGWKPTKSGE